MSETHTHSLNRRVREILLAGALLSLAIFLVARSPSFLPLPTETFTLKEAPNSLRRLDEFPTHTPSDIHLQSYIVPPTQSDFYRTIIDNNLFRPLGWTPPRPVEPYRLLGTILPRDGHTPPQAILQATATNKTHIVTIGDKLNADTKVVEIQSKQVRLEAAGQQKTLHLKRGFLRRR
ncbi:hypothetical protein C6503_14485 [Candidatus Poribacteria bacterium]|nr:MAG: hypothetical protein C6503_14485 [Candidatus Poribacteria bacterium]